MKGLLIIGQGVLIIIHFLITVGSTDPSRRKFRVEP